MSYELQLAISTVILTLAFYFARDAIKSINKQLLAGAVTHRVTLFAIVYLSAILLSLLNGYVAIYHIISET